MVAYRRLLIPGSSTNAGAPLRPIPLQPVLVASDSFNRADTAANAVIGTTEVGALAWQRLAGPMHIEGQRLVNTSTTSIHVIDIGVSDLEVSLLLGATNSATRRGGICFRVVDTANYLRLWYDGTAIRVTQVVAGVGTVLVSTGTTGAIGGSTIRVRAVGDDITAWVAALPPVQATTTAHLTATKVGVGGDAGVWIDDFAAYRLE